MRFHTKKEHLLKNAQIVCNIISTKTALPILSNILIETNKDKTTLVTTDLDMGISTTFTTNTIEDGSITIPGKRFVEIIRELPDEEIIISTKKNNIMSIECGRCLFKIIGLPKEEFPKLPTLQDKNSILIEQATLNNMLNLTYFAVSHDETRYVLNGALFDIKENRFRIVATDGRRLAMVERGLNTPKGFIKKVIVPIKTINELIRNLKDHDELKIVFGENQVLFQLEPTTIISRLIEGEYPNYEQAIPKETKEGLEIDREKLLLATKRAGILTTQDSQAIKIDLQKGKIIISKSTPDLGEAKEELEADYNGQEMSIGFNPNYIIDALRNISQPKLKVEFLGLDKPGVIRTPQEDFIYIVLPMQLG